MNAKDLLKRIFPPPRRRVTVRSILPLFIFLATFIGCWIFLEFRGIIQFSSTGPLYLLAVTPWVWWMHFAGLSGLRGVRGFLALMTRLALIGVFIMLLAEPRAVRRSNALTVVYAVDISDSIGEKALDEALHWVAKTVTEKPEKDEAGMVVFGRDAAVELPPRISFPFEVINSRVSKDSTDIAKGLSLAAAVLPEENQGRIVFISDGSQTEGNLSRILDELKSREIAVDVMPVRYDYENEVWLEKLELPRIVKVGETYEASVILSSLKAGAGKLSLQENGRNIFEKEVKFNPGKNRYILPLYMRAPGYYEYTAIINMPPGKDGWDENNVAINHLHLRGRGKVLVITDPEAGAQDWENLVDSLKATGREVELRSAPNFPADTLSLMPYDCIVFPNVPADAFNAVQLRALKDAVFNQGIGFLMVGGKNSFGPGGYHRTPVEEALPVSMDISQRKVMPKGALVIVLHTCEFARGNTWGKRIAKEAIKVLGERDEVGILVYSFSGREKWLFPLTPAGEYERLVTLINAAQIGDMPSFSTTMQMGLTALKASDAAMKHVIIISDGDPSPPPNTLIQGFVNAKISVSTVSINPHGAMATPVMQQLAAQTGGRHYFPKDPRKLPSIFIKEAKKLKRCMIQNKVFTPEVEFSSPVLKGIDALPELRGYVLTTPKSRATVILKGPETEEVDPVLATWRFGLAKTAAFTSDLSTNWGKAWVTWERYSAFVNQLMTDISRAGQKTDIHMMSYAAGNDGIIVIEDFSKKESFLEIEAKVVGPRQQSKTLELKQVGPGRYTGKFPLWGKGLYQITAVGAGEGRSERALSGFAVPYSPEYLRFRSNPFVLEQVAHRTGGRMLTGEETGQDIYGRNRKPRDSSRPVFDWFLVLLAILVPLDVGIRRIQIELKMIFGIFGLGRKKTASGKTLGALLQVKKGIKFVEDEGKEAADLETTPAARVPVSGGKGPAARKKREKKPEKEKKVADGLSTTERLLEMKKKWKEKNPGQS